MTNKEKQNEFPFYTCENISKTGIIAQPYSTTVNIATLCILFYFAVNSKSFHAKMAIMGIFMVQAFHTFSHTIHIPGTFQRDGIHVLTYISDILLLWAFYKNTNVFPKEWFIALFICLIGIDIYAVINHTLIIYLITNGLLFSSILFYYYGIVDKNIKNMIPLILVVASIGVVLFYNETKNCNEMRKMIPWFPFHVIIELVNMVLFTVMGMTFTRL